MREPVIEMGRESDESRRRLHPIHGLRLLLPYRENNQLNWVKMYMLFQGHLDMHNGIMNMAHLPYVAQSGALHTPGAPGNLCVIEQSMQ